jgi:hypothetical protein
MYGCARLESTPHLEEGERQSQLVLYKKKLWCALHHGLFFHDKKVQKLTKIVQMIADLDG